MTWLWGAVLASWSAGCFYLGYRLRPAKPITKWRGKEWR